MTDHETDSERIRRVLREDRVYVEEDESRILKCVKDQEFFHIQFGCVLECACGRHYQLLMQCVCKHPKESGQG